MTISHRFHVWQGKRWETSLWIQAPLLMWWFATIFQSVSWATVRSFPHKQCNKCIPKSSMVWPHWHYETWCATVGCGILRWVQNVVRKWVEDKWNEEVLGWTNNQAPIARPTQEWRCACTIFEGAFVRSEVIRAHVVVPSRKIAFENRIAPLYFQKERHVIERP
jgi:hypothetical protein